MSFIKKREAKDFDVIIGFDSSADGEIVTSGSVRIEGKVSGSIKSKGDVIIGVNAVVNADIEAQYCEISGKVNGNINSDSQLKVFKSGSLIGDITVTSFTIEEGGVFCGNCDITPNKKDLQKENKINKNNKQKVNKTNKNNEQKVNKPNDSKNEKKIN